MAKATDLIHGGYRVDKYRAIHADVAFKVVPLAWGMLTRDGTIRPPQ